MHPVSTRDYTERVQVCRKLLFVIVALAVVGHASQASAQEAPPPPAPVTPVVQVEAEGFRLPAGSTVVSDPSASEGRAVRVTTNGAPFGMYPFAAGVAMTLRLRGDQCQGAPTAALEIDGVTVGSVPVPATTWTEYQVAASVASGSHWIAVRFANDKAATGCDRSLYIDWVRVDQVVVPPPPAVNTGTPGSVCAAQDGGLAFTAPGPGLVAEPIAGAPAYHEIGAPTGEYAGVAPKGVMLVIHGGGWFIVGPGAVAASRVDADAWRARGWETWNVSYRACAQSLDDVLWFYDQARAAAGDSAVCASGASAGGHLAMMVADVRTDLDCVITRGSPLNLTSLATDGAYDPPTGGTQTAGPTKAYYWAVAAFGEARLAELSPTLRVGEISAAVLVGIAERDVFVGRNQATDFVASYRLSHPQRIAEIQILGYGVVPWVHASVSTDALVAFGEAETTFAAGILAELLPDDAAAPSPDVEQLPSSPEVAEPPVETSPGAVVGTETPASAAAA